MATLLQNQYTFILNSAGCCDTPPPADYDTKPPALSRVLDGMPSRAPVLRPPMGKPGTLPEFREFYGILRNFVGLKFKFHADEN